MEREHLADLGAFFEVAQARSFTQAAATLRISQSALSQTIFRLEDRLGVRLLTRTTRSVAPTEAGEHLLQTLTEAMRMVDASLAGMSEHRDKPAGKIRIAAGEHAAQTILYPVLKEWLSLFPYVQVEIVADDGQSELGADRVDAVIRAGEEAGKEIVAVRISPDFRHAIVGAPSYFAEFQRPTSPRDLVSHQCLVLTSPAHRASPSWRFAKSGHRVKVRVAGPLAFNSIAMALDAALDGLGLANVPEDQVEEHVASGRLIRVLKDWAPPVPGYYLLHSTRRQPSPVLALLAERLRYPPIG